MKRSMLVTMSILMALSASTATAAVRANEVRAKMEKEIKESRERMKSQKADVTRTEVLKDLAAMSKGGVGTTELTTALGRSLTISSENLTISVLEIATSLKATNESLQKVNRNELDADAVKLVEQKERALMVGSKFLALAGKTSKAVTADQQKNLDVLAKEISLLPEIVTSMDAAQAKSHLDIMELAVEKMLQNPQMTGEAALFEVLKDKFGAKVSAKIEEILGCARG